MAKKYVYQFSEGNATMRELLERSGGTLEAGLEGEIYRSTLTFRKYRSEQE